MSSVKDGFPASSRTSGARLHQAAAHEAHPLLSPGAPSSSPADNGQPKYVPYTPRQRVMSAATTSGTVVHPQVPALPQYQQGNATTKLQLMHLKAAAQNVGLDSSTVGWTILEKLGAPNDSEDWNEIWHAITMARASLFLPLEPLSANEKVTSDLVKDHIYFWDLDTQVVTMSGLRGRLDGETVSFRSAISPSSKLFQDITSPITRATAFSLLPPLPNFSNPYPKVTMQSEETTLPLPPRTAPAYKPPLPPRPSGRPGQPSRIPNPFASLFGGNVSKNAVVPASPPASIRSLESQDAGPIDITIVTTDSKISRKDVVKVMNKTLKSELREMLLSATTPPPIWVVDRVQDFAAEWFPFVRIQDSPAYEPNPFEENPDDAADRLQDFYAMLEQDLLASGSPFIPSPRLDGDVEGRREREQTEIESRVRDVMEAVERALCCLFYDRLFMQPVTDDASHDETLTSRIAALNKLDLGLEHLDVLVGNIGPDLDVVVEACGDMLRQLDPCRCPADKASVLVAAHRVLVDGLARLPPIVLRGEDEPQTAKPIKKSPEPVLSHINILKTTASSQSDLSGDKTPTVASMTRMPSGDSTLPSPSPLPLPTPLPTEPTPSNESTSPSSTTSKLTLELERPQTKGPTPVSGDVLFPMIIFSVVKSNPPHLLSNLLFTQRFRNQAVGGEESYCLINMMAVAEFLENVDLEGLGLTDADKVLSAADLTPFPLTRSPVTSETPLVPSASSDALHGGLRGRVEQQVDAIADSANKVISGVVDSSFGILRSFLPNNPNAGHDHNSNNNQFSGGSRPTTPGALNANPNAPYAAETSNSPWRSNASLPRTGLSNILRRDRDSSGMGGKEGGSGFSITNIAAALPIPSRRRANTSTGEERGQQLVSVSRPGSVRSRASLKIRVAGDSSDEETTTTSTEESDDSEDDSGAGAANGNGRGDKSAATHNHNDGRIMLKTGPRSKTNFASFDSMVAADKARNSPVVPGRELLSQATSTALSEHVPASSVSPESRFARKSLSDRLARVSSNLSTKGTREDSLLLQPPYAVRRDHSRSPSPTGSSRSPSPSPSPIRPSLILPLSPSGGGVRSLSPSPISSPVIRSTSPLPRSVSPVRRSTSPMIPSHLHQQHTALAPGGQHPHPHQHQHQHQHQQIRIPPPVQRFLDVTPGDLRLCEIGELVRDYRRLVDALRAIDAFEK